MTRNWSHCFCISLTGCWKWRRLLWAACRDLQRSHSQTQWLPREEGPRHYVLCGSILLRAEQELERGNHKVIARLIHFIFGQWLGFSSILPKIQVFYLTRESSILDSKPWIPDSRYWILYRWNLDSGFQSLVGFRIPWAVFRIPKSRIPDSTTKVFSNSGMRIPLHGALLVLSRASDSGEVEGFVTCSTAQANSDILKLFPSTLVVSWRFQIFLDTSMRVLSRLLRLRDLAGGVGGGWDSGFKVSTGCRMPKITIGITGLKKTIGVRDEGIEDPIATLFYLCDRWSLSTTVGVCWTLLWRFSRENR